MAPTTAKLKGDIDRGRAGDKVDAVDPAIVPLGTDEEAAGTPPAAGTVRVAYENEVGGRSVSPTRRDPDNAVVIYLTAVGTIASAIGFAIWLTP
jgi:hypothetical protein